MRSLAVLLGVLAGFFGLAGSAALAVPIPPTGGSAYLSAIGDIEGIGDG